MEIKYPHLRMALVGEDGNAFSIMARLDRVLTRGGVSKSDVEVVMDDMKSGDYDHLLRVVVRTVATDEAPDIAVDLGAVGWAYSRRCTGPGATTWQYCRWIGPQC
jgi:hypothetical protein